MLLLLLLSLAAPLPATAQYRCTPTTAGLSDNCIGCICEASTKCDKSAACIGRVSAGPPT